MNQRHLTLLCLISFGIGTVVLVLVSLTDPDTATISEIDDGMVGEYVSVNGAISSLHERNGNVFFDLRQGSNSIESVIFKSDNNGWDLREGQEVWVKAEVSMYKGKLELIISDLRSSS